MRWRVVLAILILPTLTGAWGAGPAAGAAVRAPLRSRSDLQQDPADAGGLGLRPADSQGDPGDAPIPCGAAVQY